MSLSSENLHAKIELVNFMNFKTASKGFHQCWAMQRGREGGRERERERER